MPGIGVGGHSGEPQVVITDLNRKFDAKIF